MYLKQNKKEAYDQNVNFGKQINESRIIHRRTRSVNDYRTIIWTFIFLITVTVYRRLLQVIKRQTSTCFSK